MTVVFAHHPQAVVYKKPVPDLICKYDTSDMQPSPNYRGRVVEPVVHDSPIVWDTEWLAEQYAKIPEEFHAGIKAKYQSLLVSGSVASEGRRKANNYLLDAVDLFATTSHKRLVAHEHNAQIASLQVQLFGLEAAAQWAKAQGVKVPRFPKHNKDPNKKNSRVSVERRLCCPKWWDKQLTKKFRRDAEGVQYRAGNICEGVSVYCSVDALDKYLEQKAAEEAWRKRTVLISDEGDEVSLDGADHAHDQNFVRFAEFITRVNGMVGIAEDNYLDSSVVDLLPDGIKEGQGGSLADVGALDALDGRGEMVGLFYSLTAPSRYHRYTKRSGKTVLNRHYDKTKTPTDARDWLQETWKLTQTAWKRKTKHIDPIQGFGFRVEESHHDGVGHYHYAIWVKASDAQRATEIFYNKALRGNHTDRLNKRYECKFGEERDATERGAEVRRLNFKIMTSAKGMVAYMIPYITKALTGASWQDLKAGMSSKESFINLMARKSVWGIRQFSFWNAPSVMVWRELWKINETLDDELLESARQAVKAKDWKAFTEINGGAYAPACERPLRMLRLNKLNADSDLDFTAELRTAYKTGDALTAGAGWVGYLYIRASGEVSDDNMPYKYNQYGERIEQIRGIGGASPLITRKKEWYLLNKDSLKTLLINKFLRESDTPKSALPVTFGDDIQSVIDTAKQQGKLTRLADKAGIVMFNPPTAESSRAMKSPLGLVGITSHDIDQPPEILT